MPSHNENVEGYFLKRAKALLYAIRPPEDEMAKFQKYRRDPVRFCKEVLGIWPHKKQCEILESLCNYKSVSVASGHKCGKSLIWAVMALWFYCCFDGGRVVIMAATDRQVNSIIWKEVRRLTRKSVVPIPNAAEIHLKAAAGLVNPIDDSEIKGYTAKTPEAVAGTSGHSTLYLFDEASGIDDAIFSAMDGNTAGGNSWMCLISNPTKAEGEFYRSHHSQKYDPVTNPHGYYAIHMSCYDSPNVTGEWKDMYHWVTGIGWVQNTEPIPGLAQPEYIEKMKHKYGEDSWDFQVRVLGLFSAAEDAKIFPRHLLEEAHERWLDDEDSRKLGGNYKPPEGRLYIGCDPAGYAEGGDQSGFAVRRGNKILELTGQRGLSPEAHIVKIQGLILQHAISSDKTLKPIVVIESEGNAGWEVYKCVNDHAHATGEFEVFRLKTSDKAVREPHIYDRIRDELWMCGAFWLRRDKGMLPPHSHIDDDLHAAEWAPGINGLLKATPKTDLKQLLGRSPDIGDAFLMCCWEPMYLKMGTNVHVEQAPPPTAYEGIQHVNTTMSPYEGMRAWQ
jgi:hypothetical protein